LSRRFETSAWIPLILAIPFAATLFIGWQELGTLLGRTPGWDEAGHAYDGLLLAELIRQGQPFQAFLEFFGMSYWPPAVAVYLMPFYWLGSLDIATARSAMQWQGMALVVACGWSAWSLAPRHRALAAAAAMLVVAISPAVALFGTVVMLEVPASLLVVLTLTAYVQYRVTGDSRPLKVCAVSGALLFFCKYNYWLLTMAPITAIEVLRYGTVKHWWRAAALSGVAQTVWRRPFYRGLVLYSGLCLVLMLVPKIQFTIAEREVRLGFSGNLIYAGALAMLIRLLLRRDEARQCLQFFRTLPSELRVFTTVSFAPVAIWFINPMNLKTFVQFLVNESTTSGQSLEQRLMFYPRMLAEWYAAAPWIAATISAGTLGMAIATWRRKQPHRWFYLIAILGIIACMAHPNHIDRYFFPYFFLLVIGGACALASIIPRGKVGMLVSALGITAAIAAAPHYLPQPHTQFRQATLESGPDRAARRLCEHNREQQGITVVGLWYDLSPSLLAFRCLADGTPFAQLPKSSRDLRLEPKDPNFARKLDRKGTPTIVVIDLVTDQRAAAEFFKTNRHLTEITKEIIDTGNYKALPIELLALTDYRLQLLKRHPPES
jgi:4-amino-4-deoxy-L-arabinose transferase-like glycosyltransferase